MPFFRTLLIVILSCTFASSVAARDWTLQMKHDGLLIEGDPIHWSKREFFILGRDGKLWEFDVRQAPKAKKIKKPFSSYSQLEMRNSLQGEYGVHYDVSGTGHFLVVHPVGQRDQWAGRFEQLYREMIFYFSSRGISVRQPSFPLVAVVFPTQSEFLSHASKDGLTDSGILGYYSTMSNRILLYDQTGGRNPDWRENAATIVHEAAHQTAYNIGIHNRFGDTPRWLSEGLGTLFEARGVNNGTKFRKLEDRINRDQLYAFRRYYPEEMPAGTLQSLVADDRAFRAAALRSYATSWAVIFTLAERYPMKLAEYLRLSAKPRRGFMVQDSPSLRLRDFEQAFGQDPDHVQRLVDGYIRGLM